MSMYPEDIAGRDFVIAPEGFDREEVRAFLEVVARDQQALHDQIAKLHDQLAGEDEIGKEVALVLEAARMAAEEALHRTSEEVTELRARAEADADQLRRGTTDAADKTREEANLYAAAARAEAERDARQRLQETNERIERLLSGTLKVRKGLIGLDAVLESVRAEVVEASGALDDAADVEIADVPPPPPPVIQLREASAI